jgi:hypothetical protein
MKNWLDTPFTRRMVLKTASVVTRFRPAAPTASDAAGASLAVDTTAKKLIDFDAFDTFWNETPQYSTTLNWIISLQEFRDEFFKRQGLDKISRLLKNYNDKKIGAAREVAYQILFWRHHKKVEFEGLHKAIAKFQHEAPSVELLREILGHPVFRESEEYGLFVGHKSVSEAARTLHEATKWPTARVQNYIQSHINACDSYMQSLEDLASNPDVAHEMRLLNARGYPHDPRLKWIGIPDFPQFSTKYRENSFPIPHDYYAKPKADSWAERLELQTTRMDSNVR